MYKNLNSKSFVSRCKCVSCFDTILVVNPEEGFSHDVAQNSWVLVFGSASIDLSFVVCIFFPIYTHGKKLMNTSRPYFMC